MILSLQARVDVGACTYCPLSSSTFPAAADDCQHSTLPGAALACVDFSDLNGNWRLADKCGRSGVGSPAVHEQIYEQTPGTTFLHGAAG